jgi:hypothetical protein
MKKSCKKGYYYCFTSKKCKKIPVGYHVMGSGRLMKDSEHEEKKGGEESTETTKNGNGNGGNGGAVSEGWSNKYKKSIDCKNPKGFSQRAHCQGRKVNEAKEKDHEVSMAKTQVKKSIDNLQKVARVLAKKTDADNLPAWVQSKLTDTEHNTDAAASYMTGKEDLDEGKRDGKSAKDKGYSLRDWFKGGGWVQTGGKYDGKPCAKQKGQKTKPFCRDADDRAAMSKEERNKRAKKKRREDPNPNRKGKAKMVGEQIDTSGQPFNNVFVRAVENAGGRRKDVIPSTPKSANPKTKIKEESYSNWREELAEGKQYQPGDIIPDSATKPKPKPTGAARFKFSVDKTGLKGPDKPLTTEEKDACYKKVKSRYKIWPSAYASGALSKCRKVGAANWGNSTKKEGYEFSNWRDDFVPTEIETTDLITPEPIQVPPSNLQKIEEKCWVGYKQLGMKKKGKKMVPNCVKEGYSNWRQELSEEGADVWKDKRQGSEPKSTKPEYKNPYGLKGIAPGIRALIQKAHFEPEGELIEDWQKVNKKDKTDGMSQKAVDAYKRENPGSKLKTAVTEKNPGGKRAKRRKSFCARSNGQRKMHNIDCSKTPDKAICKARKRWRC